VTARTWTRRGFCIRAAGAALAAAAAPFVNGLTQPTSPIVEAASDNAARAANAYAAMQRYFYVEDQKLYRESYPAASEDEYAYFWTYEEAAKATLYMYGLPGGVASYGGAIQDRLAGRESYWDGGVSQRGYHSDIQGGDRYYDDNDWAGSNLLQHALLTTGPSSLTAADRAGGVFRYIMQTGWFGYPGGEPGGVFWVNNEENQDRGTGATGGAAKLGAHLFYALGRREPALLSWATHMYDWVRENLLSPENGLYWDKVLPDGSIDQTQWIYNQGIMIGASTLLYAALSGPGSAGLGDPAPYLKHAEDLASRALDAYATDPFYSGGRGAYGGRAIFNAIFWRNLLLLYVVNKKSVYLQKMQAYADHAWNDRATHDQRTGLFNYDPASSSPWLLDQAAMVQVYACLGWDPRTYGKLA